MSMIKVSNLTFNYDNHPDNIFENVSFNIDTDWKLGFIGRNGKGKTTLLNLLLGKYEYSGSIVSSVEFDYFPFKVKDNSDELFKDEPVTNTLKCERTDTEHVGWWYPIVDAKESLWVEPYFNANIGKNMF